MAVNKKWTGVSRETSVFFYKKLFSLIKQTWKKIEQLLHSKLKYSAYIFHISKEELFVFIKY